MESQNSPAPRRRRSVQPLSEKPVSMEPPSQPARLRRSVPHSPASAPEAIQRNAVIRRTIDQARQPQPIERPKPHAPRWLAVSVAVCMVLCLCLTTAQLMMQAYLTEHERTRAEEKRQLLAKYDIPQAYAGLLEQYAEAYNLQPAFVASIIFNESHFDQKAESSVGARGLMQLMENTAQWIAGKIGDQGYSFSWMWDPESNIRYGCWYLHYLSDLFDGDPIAVTAAYHAGQGTVSNWLRDPGVSADGHTLSLEALPEGRTKTYVGRVTRDYAIFDAIRYHAFNSPVDSADAGVDAASF